MLVFYLLIDLNTSSSCGLVLVVAKIGRLSTKDSVLFLCDMQEKFSPNIFQFTNIVSNAARVLQVENKHHYTTVSLIPVNKHLTVIFNY